MNRQTYGHKMIRKVWCSVGTTSTFALLPFEDVRLQSCEGESVKVRRRRGKSTKMRYRSAKICEGESAKLQRPRSDTIFAPLPSQLHTLNFALSLSLFLLSLGQKHIIWCRYRTRPKFAECSRMLLVHFGGYRAYYIWKSINILLGYLTDHSTSADQGH